MITIAFGMISVVALGAGFCIMNLNGRVNSLENQIKRMRGLDQPPVPIATTKDYMDLVDKEIEELQKFNPSYGDPTYTEWIDRDYDSKGVK